MTAPTGREGAIKNAFTPSPRIGAVNIFCQTYIRVHLRLKKFAEAITMIAPAQ